MNKNCAAEMLDKTGSRISSLKLLSYNIQVGITTRNSSDYVTHFWKHVFPHGQRDLNLKNIAAIIKDYDLVGLQELDGGSLRSGFINHAEYLALHGGFPYWIDRTNRNLGKIAKHSLGLVSRIRSIEVERHPLPGRLPGRGALIAKFGDRDPLVLAIVHLALGKTARMKQLEHIAELLGGFEHAVVMGDFNCSSDSEELQLFREKTGLRGTVADTPTYPSWEPQKRIDHILVSGSIGIRSATVLDCGFSDHLPLAVEIDLPEPLVESLSCTAALGRAAA